MIKNFDTYINEKFDYTKQRNFQKSFLELEEGDIYYRLSKMHNPDIQEVKVKIIKNNMGSLSILTKALITFNIANRFMVDDMCVESLGKRYYISSTSRETMENFIKSKYFQEIKHIDNMDDDANEKYYNIILNFKRQK